MFKIAILSIEHARRARLSIYISESICISAYVRLHLVRIRAPNTRRVQQKKNNNNKMVISATCTHILVPSASHTKPFCANQTQTKRNGKHRKFENKKTRHQHMPRNFHPSAVRSENLLTLSQQECICARIFYFVRMYVCVNAKRCQELCD